MEKPREEYKPKLDHKTAIAIIGYSILGQYCIWLFTLGFTRNEIAEATFLPWLTLPRLGMICLIFGIFWAAMEKKDDLPFFYGYAQSAGNNINSSGVCAIAITGLSARGLHYYGIWLIIVLTVVLAERYYIDYMRYKKIVKYLGNIGVAKTDIDYKGKAKIGNELMKVRIRKNAIKAGTSLQVVGIQGFMLVVEPL